MTESLREKIESAIEEAITTQESWDGQRERVWNEVDTDLAADNIEKLIKETFSQKTVEIIAGRKKSTLLAMNGVKHPVTIECDPHDEREEYICPQCRTIVAYKHKYCHSCGSPIIWEEIKTDPREKIICHFCGCNIIQQPSMVQGGKGRICVDCLLTGYSKLNIERVVNSTLVNLDNIDNDDDL